MHIHTQNTLTHTLQLECCRCLFCCCNHVIRIVFSPLAVMFSSVKPPSPLPSCPMCRGYPKGGECQPCAPECASCLGNATHCLSCETQYLLLEHSCRGHCPEGHYPNERECLRCPPDCIECSQDGLCKGKAAARGAEVEGSG